MPTLSPGIVLGHQSKVPYLEFQPLDFFADTWNIQPRLRAKILFYREHCDLVAVVGSLWIVWGVCGGDRDRIFTGCGFYSMQHQRSSLPQPLDTGLRGFFAVGDTLIIFHGIE